MFVRVIFFNLYNIILISTLYAQSVIGEGVNDIFPCSIFNYLDSSISVSINPEGLKLANQRPYSFMLGINSNLPTFYVGPSNGLNTSGEVGIGTTNTNGFKLRVAGDVSFDRVSIGGEYIPEKCLLSVGGSVYCTDIIVASHDNWPDYVFDENYELLEIDQLQSYIEKESHLPGVPTKEEINSLGLSQSELNELLLKKIEELNLYIIEMHNEINNIQNRSF